MCFYINNDLFWNIGSFVWFTEMICKQMKFSIVLRPVHTKDDNYKDNDRDIVLNIALNIKE